MAEHMDIDTDGDCDPEGYLQSQHRGVTILALRMSSRRKMGLYLNIEAVPHQDGTLPNYEGLAELIGFDFLEQQKFGRDSDPTLSLLVEWGNRPELEPTLGKLEDFLLKLERFDVLEDCKALIEKDAEHYLKKNAAGSSEISPVQDATVSQSPFNIDEMSLDETTIMSIQDVENCGPTYYDAFVCYHPEGHDLTFVKTMIEKMECPPNNLKLFVPHRDDLPGSAKHVISAKLIQDRCRRMVIVMSPRYLQSDACDFQTKFAHALSPGSRSKKLVPVLVQQCETPNILRHVTFCDYSRGDLNGWFWDRLIKSLQAPLFPGDITTVGNPRSLSDIQMNIQKQSTTYKSLTTPTTTTAATTAGRASQSSTTTLSSSSSSSSSSGVSPSHNPKPSGGSLPRREAGGRATPPVGRVAGGQEGQRWGSTDSVDTGRGAAASSSPVGERKKKTDFKSKLRSVFSSSSSSSQSHGPSGSQC